MSEPADDDDSPWALQLAARVEKLTPPTTRSICEATALATIALLDDERAQPDGEWHEPIATWSDVRIRKLVRRGRASAWDRAQDVPGVTIAHEGAEVRAFVPSRMADAPPEVAKLQIQSSDLDEPEQCSTLPVFDSGELVIAVTPVVEMSWGKAAAQCAHAAQLLWWATDDARREQWRQAAQPILVVFASESLWPQLDEIAEVSVHDAGYTEIPAGTNTTIAWWGSGGQDTELDE